MATKTKTASAAASLENADLNELVRDRTAAIVHAADTLAGAEDTEDQNLIRAVYRAGHDFGTLWLDVDAVPRSLGYCLPALVAFAEEVLAAQMATASEASLPRRDQFLPAPSRTFIAALGDLWAMVSRPPAPAELPRLESIEQLNREGVYHEQIARMYGFLDDRGNPERWKVEEELKQPGKWTGDGWVDPRIKADDGQTAKVEMFLAQLERIARRCEAIGCDWSD